jgi:hypothetical protein
LNIAWILLAVAGHRRPAAEFARQQWMTAPIERYCIKKQCPVQAFLSAQISSVGENHNYTRARHAKNFINRRGMMHGRKKNGTLVSWWE